MAKRIPEYVVVEGPIGVGKTTLAIRLAKTFNVDLMLEQPQENPFLPRFYEDPKAGALPTQLHFLFQRVKLIESLRQTDMFKKAQVSDFLIQKDRLFAQLTLDEHELDLYQQVYNRLTLAAPVPDLVIYLQAPAEVLMRRILERGHSYERKIEEDYLQRVADAYIEFFYHYDASPLLIINTRDFNFADDEKNYDLILDYIYDLPPGRHYFNPLQL